MYKKLSFKEWEKYINEYYSDNSEISIKDYCIQHNLNKGQFFYNKRKLKKINEPILQAIKFNDKESCTEEYAFTSSEVKISIGKTNIAIPISETTLITSIIKELISRC